MLSQRSSHVIILIYKWVSPRFKKHRNSFTSIKTLMGHGKDIEFYFKEGREERLGMEWCVMPCLTHSRSFRLLGDSQSLHKAQHRAIYYKEPRERQFWGYRPRTPTIWEARVSE